MNNLYIVILNYNSSEDTVKLYNQIQSFNLRDVTIKVIDNASTSNNIELLKQNIPNEYLILNSKNLGYAAGNNIGIQEAIDNNFEYVLLLNPDIRLKSDCIKFLLKEMYLDDSLAVIGPRICFRENHNVVYSDGGILIKEKGFFTTHLNYKKAKQECTLDNNLHCVDYVNGSCFLARTRVFKEIGFLCESFFMYFEETEWCMRAIQEGYNVKVFSDAEAYHTSSKKGSKYHFYMTRNRLLLAKHNGQYYKVTLQKIRQNILKEVKKSIKSIRFLDTYLYSKIKGYIYGIFQKLNL